MNPQLYVLIIIFNTLSGISILLSEEDDVLKLRNLFHHNAFTSAGFRIVLALITGLVSLIKLIFSFEEIPVLGDLLPSLAGLAAAITLMVQYYLDKTENPSSFMFKLENIFVRNKRIFGLIALGSAIIHFLVPAIPVI